MDKYIAYERILKYMYETTYEEIYMMYFEQTVRYLNLFFGVPLEDAKDISSDVFFLLIESWDELDAHDVQSIGRWIGSTAKNKYFEYKRARSKFFGQCSLDESRAGVLYDDNKHLIVRDFIAYCLVAPEEQDIIFMSYIEKIKSRLNDNECKLLDMIMAEKYDYKKISAELNQSEHYMRTRVRRLRRKIKGFLNEILE
ncbi:MAG: sigma-70 family RNA polymerase sigma factor [Clostridia bacterium]|nr:sigma-70 family RNA polymerase sigma factor [Clostridia bacterium]